MGFGPYMAPIPFFCPLLIKCNLTLLKASGARDIQSTTTMLVSLVYFLSTQSNVGKYLTYRIPPTLPPPPPLTKVDDNQFLLWGGHTYQKTMLKMLKVSFSF